MEGFFQVFCMQPILFTFGKYLALPDIIRVSATCKYGYIEWVKKIQDPFDIPNKIKGYYYDTHGRLVSVEKLRDFCFEFRTRNEQTRNGRNMGCINCGTYRTTNNVSWYDAFMDRKFFPFGLCRVCFSKPRRLNYSGLMHMNDAVKSLISAGCVFDVSPFDFLRPYVVNLLDGDYGRWNLIKIRTVMEIIKSFTQQREVKRLKV